MLDHFNQGGCARYRLRGDVLDHGNRKGCARHRMRGGGGAGPPQSKRVCAISSVGGGAGPLQSKGVCAISSARRVCVEVDQGGRAISCGGIHGGGWTVPGGRCTRLCGHGAWVRDVVCAGGCWTTAIKGSLHDMVCAGCGGPLPSKRACALSSVPGGCGPCYQRGHALYVFCTGATHWDWIGTCSCWPFRLFYLQVGFRVPGLTLFRTKWGEAQISFTTVASFSVITAL